MAFFKKLFEEDLSGLDEYECFLKAQEYWDHRIASYGNPTKALKYLDRAIQLNPQKIEAYTGRGIAYQRLGKFDLAIENFNQAIKLELSGENYRGRGSCYLQFRQYDKALADYNTMIKLSPNELGYYVIRAGLYALIGEFRLAILDYNFIIDREPYNFDNYVCRGYQYYELGEYQKAIEDYDKALELQPNISKIREYRRMAYQKLKK
jgi:tetratricopeptide (TPR) repeat protein